MNGSENGYAGALFFAIMSLGAIFKLDDALGGFVGLISAFAAAFCLRQALIKSAQAAEEDHQRLEVQFQQLRSKVGESSAANFDAMTSITDSAQIVQENLQIIRARLAELDNLNKIAENAESIRLALAALDDNSSALNAELEKIIAALQEQNSAAEIKNLTEIETENKATLQTVAKLLQLIGQMLKSPTYSSDLEKISASLDNISEKIAAINEKNNSRNEIGELNRQDMSLRKKIAAKIKGK